MIQLRSIKLRISALFRRRQLQKDLDDELSFHMSMLEANGEGKPAAHRRFGNIAKIREQCFEIWTFAALERFWADVRYAGRTLRKNKGFTAFVILALAIGVGANITIFGLASTVLLRPVDASEPERLVRAIDDSILLGAIEYEDYLQYKDRNQSLLNLAIFNPGGLMPVRLNDLSEIIAVTPVSGNYFQTLGVSASIGRVIRPDDDKEGDEGVVVLAHRFWEERFGRDPAVVGRTILIRRVPFRVIGITPESFEGTTSPTIPQLYVPWNAAFGPKSGHLIGRLRPGVSQGEAQADLSRIAAQIRLDEGKSISVKVYPATKLYPQLIAPVTLFAVVLLIVVGVVLLIACDNIAILLLVRSAVRRREIAIRLALGAGRPRLLRQILAESLLLSLIGGAAAIGLAFITARLLTQIYLPVPMPIALTFEFDWRVAAFAVGISFVASLLFGLGPALGSINTDPMTLIKAGGRNGAGSESKIRSGLVITQVCLSTVLLATAGVLVQSLISAPNASSRGFDTDNVLMTTVNLTTSGYTRDKGIDFYNRLLERLEGEAGIVSATIADNVPLTNNNLMAVAEMESENPTGPQGLGILEIYTNRISHGHFRTLHIPVLDGRDFLASDRGDTVPVGIVNETLAHRFWPGQSPIGRRLRMKAGQWIEIIGLVRNSKYTNLREEPKALLYRPVSQQYFETGTLLLKTAGDPRAAVSLVRTRISELDPDVIPYNLNTLEQRIGLNVLPNRVVAIVSGTLGLLALVLSAAGIYGTMSFLVAQRKNEIGIRMALGAEPADVVGLVIRQGISWTGIGLGLGLACAYAMCRLLSMRFYGVSPSDPIAFLGTILLLGCTSCLACYVPARRASRTDPMISLRAE